MINKTIMIISAFAMLLFAGENQYYKQANKTIAAGDTVSGDYFFAGSDLHFNGIASSDLYVFSRSVEFTGKTGDDFYAFCQDITSKGEVTGNLFAGGQQVEIEGVVHGDIFAAGGSVFIRPGTIVDGSVHVGTGYFVLGENSKIKGNLYVGAGQADLSGEVDGKSKLQLGSVNFTETFSSKDSVYLRLHEEPETEIVNAPQNMKISIIPQKHFFQEGFFFWMLISVIVIGIILISLFPELPARFEELTSTQWAQNLGYGALFFLITPIVAILAIAILPAAFIIGGIYAIMLYLSTIFSAIALGEVLLKDKMNAYLRLSLVLLAIYILVEIPLLGGLLSLLLIIFGMGLFFNYIWQVRRGKWLQA